MVPGGGGGRVWVYFLVVPTSDRRKNQTLRDSDDAPPDLRHRGVEGHAVGPCQDLVASTSAGDSMEGRLGPGRWQILTALMRPELAALCVFFLLADDKHDLNCKKVPRPVWGLIRVVVLHVASCLKKTRTFSSVSPRKERPRFSRSTWWTASVLLLVLMGAYGAYFLLRARRKSQKVRVSQRCRRKQ